MRCLVFQNFRKKYEKKKIMNKVKGKMKKITNKEK